MDETELIAKAAAGDSDAFGELVAPHLGLFFNGIQRILGNRADAQDALQDGLVSIFEDLPSFQARSRFSSWAYKVCINAALMFRRSHVRIREESMDAPTGLGEFDAAGHHLDTAAALDEAERRQLRQCLLQALDDLPDSLRVVFVLKDLEDWSTEAIAARLDQAAATVRQRLHRARVRIQERLRAHVQGRPS